MYQGKDGKQRNVKNLCTKVKMGNKEKFKLCFLRQRWETKERLESVYQGKDGEKGMFRVCVPR